MTYRPPRLAPLVRTTCVAAAMVLLAACGGGDDDAADLKTPAELAAELQGEDQDDAGDDAGGDGDTGNEGDDPAGSDRTGTIAFKLPDSVEAPDGFTMIDDECASEDSRGGVVTYAVPDDWDNTGGGMSGSGGGLEGSIDHRFTTTDGEIIIEVAGDRHDDEGRILNGSNEPDESFDYEYTVGDRTTQVEYESVINVSLEYQDVEVFSVDEATYPDPIQGEEFRVRFEAFESEWDLGGIDQTAVMTISAPTGAIDEELLETIVASLVLPQCARDSIIVGQEMISSADLDGDGKVSDANDMMALPN